MSSTGELYLVVSESGEILGSREFAIGDPTRELYEERLVNADEWKSGEEFWVSLSNQILPRPAMPLIVSGRTITGIPAGSILLLGEQSFEVDDGEAEIDGYSGTVKITCWPYLDAEVIV